MCRTGPLSSHDLKGDVKLIWEFSRGYSSILHALRAKEMKHRRLRASLRKSRNGVHITLIPPA